MIRLPLLPPRIIGHRSGSWSLSRASTNIISSSWGNSMGRWASYSFRGSKYSLIGRRYDYGSSNHTYFLSK